MNPLLDEMITRLREAIREAYAVTLNTDTFTEGQLEELTVLADLLHGLSEAAWNKHLASGQDAV